MRWGGYPGLSWWVLNTITSILIRRRLDYKEEGKGNVTTETKVQTVDFEDGGRGHEPRKAKSAIPETGKSKETDSSLEPSKGMSPADTLVSTQKNHFGLPSFQN